MPNITIDGHELEVPAGYTIIQAAEILDKEVPHFCYHSRLKIAGSCRMCLVEVDKVPKPVASCAYPVADNMVIYTDSAMVRKAREGVMEFLLINHPLDCPICDQGGECDLQDQAIAYGRDSSRYEQNKRAVANKFMGPLIKTYMTRCIHCTRCIRFVADIGGTPELGAVNRGEHMEIVSYMDKPLTSELSGNIIDLCPVGALTSKPYAYQARPWELTKTESIDVMDAVGSNIRIDSYGQKIKRILPRLHEDVNEEWISDKTRFACDGLQVQRLDTPYVRVQGKLLPTSWDEAFDVIKKKLKKTPADRIGAIAGDQADVESMLLLKEFMTSLGVKNLDCRQDGAAHDPSHRSHYLFNTTIAGIEEADLCLLIGTHPRYEAALINARIRKRFLTGQMKIARIGGSLPKRFELTYDLTDLGTDPAILEELISGKHPFSKELKKAKKPMLIIGQQALTRSDGESLLAHAGQLADTYGFIQEGWNGFNVLHTAASRVGGLDIGFVPDKAGLDTHHMLKKAEKGELDVLYLLGADELDFKSLKDTFIIYQGHHGDQGAHHASVILPGSTYTEKNATYVNTEGRVQQTQQATTPPGVAKEDWKIIRALSQACDHTLPYNTIHEVRLGMIKTNPVFTHTDRTDPAGWKSIGKAGKLHVAPIPSWSGNFYMTDPISRHSVTMAKCTTELGFSNLTHGEANVA
jgi:NADH-quinone oxidoreductase subunit G